MLCSKLFVRQGFSSRGSHVFLNTHPADSLGEASTMHTPVGGFCRNHRTGYGLLRMAAAFPSLRHHHPQTQNLEALAHPVKGDQQSVTAKAPNPTSLRCHTTESSSQRKSHSSPLHASISRGWRADNSIICYILTMCKFTGQNATCRE